MQDFKLAATICGRSNLDQDYETNIMNFEHNIRRIQYAKKYPENVSHVVMIGIAPNLGPENAQLIERAWEESVDPVRKKIMLDNLQKLPDDNIAKLSGDQAFIQSYIRNGPRIWYNPHFDFPVLQYHSHYMIYHNL